jgi:DNA-binding SARP family transcriptional activator
VEFRILGPLEVLDNDRRVRVTGDRLRVILVALLLEANRTVPVGSLVWRLWGEDPPERPRHAVSTYVMRLRQRLGGRGGIRTVPAGYRIDVAGRDLDLHRFMALTERARSVGENGDLVGECDLLDGALALWRGDPLVDVPSEPLRRETLPWLVEQRVQATERYLRVRLTLGETHGLVGELRRLTADHPFRDGLWELLMTALLLGGRRAEALAAYADLRRHYAGELGIEPGDRLRTLQRSALDPDRNPLRGRIDGADRW